AQPVQRQWSKNPQEFEQPTSQPYAQPTAQPVQTAEPARPAQTAQKKWSKNPQDFGGSAAETVNGRKTSLQPIELSADSNPTGDDNLRELPYEESRSRSDANFDEDRYVRNLKQQIEQGAAETSSVESNPAYQSKTDFVEEPMKFDGKALPQPTLNVVKLPKQSNKNKFAILIPIVLAIALCVIAYVMISGLNNKENEQSSGTSSSSSSSSSSTSSASQPSKVSFEDKNGEEIFEVDLDTEV
ncbi:MAG: hypothetical protein ACI4M3_07165, partial [Acutalibacteraceae bacterium]